MRKMVLLIVLFAVANQTHGDYVRSSVAEQVLDRISSSGDCSFMPVFERSGMSSNEFSSLLVNLVVNDPLCSTNSDKFCYHTVLGAVAGFGTTLSSHGR